MLINAEQKKQQIESLRQKTLEELKAIKLKEIKSYFSKLYSEEMNKFTSLEVSTFDSQKADYKSWIADSESHTPTVDTLAEVRGIGREYLLGKIGEKLTLQVLMVGKQQKLEDDVKRCESIKELNEIKI